MKDLGTESQSAQERVKRLTAQQQPNSHEALGSQRERDRAKRYLIRRMIVVAFSVLMLGAGVFLIVGNSGLATLLALLGLLSLILLLLSSLLPGSQSVEKTSYVTVATSTINTAPEYYHESLSYIREKLGWSQMELANRVGTTAVNVSRWERGVTSPNPYFRAQLNKLFEEYGEEEYRETYPDISSLSTEQKKPARLTRDLHSPLFFADVSLPTPSAFLEGSENVCNC